MFLHECSLTGKTNQDLRALDSLDTILHIVSTTSQVCCPLGGAGGWPRQTVAPCGRRWPKSTARCWCTRGLQPLASLAFLHVQWSVIWVAGLLIHVRRPYSGATKSRRSLMQMHKGEPSMITGTCNSVGLSCAGTWPHVGPVLTRVVELVCRRST